MNKEKAESLIYFMQKTCARESWVEFLDFLGITPDEAEDFFSDMAQKMKLDKQKFYFR